MFELFVSRVAVLILIPVVPSPSVSSSHFVKFEIHTVMLLIQVPLCMTGNITCSSMMSNTSPPSPVTQIDYQGGV
jgi:hypothetical protein